MRAVETITALRITLSPSQDRSRRRMQVPEWPAGSRTRDGLAGPVGRLAPALDQGIDDVAAWAALNSPQLGEWYISALSGLYQQQQRHGMIRPEGEPQHPLLPAILRTRPDYARELARFWRS